MVDIQQLLRNITDSNGEFEFTVYTDEEYILIGEKEIILVQEEIFQQWRIRQIKT